MNISINGHITLCEWRDGLWIPVVETDNLVLTAGFETIHDVLRGRSGATGVEYCAVGSVNPSPSAGDSWSDFTEIGRASLLTTTDSGAAQLYQFTFGQTVANGTWREIGMVGNGAGSGSETGTLLTHTAINYTKDSSTAIRVDYQLTIGSS